MNLNKKNASSFAGGLMIAAVLMWLVMGSLKFTLSSGGQSVTDIYNGMNAITGIEAEGIEAVEFNIFALLAVVIGACASILAIKSNGAAPLLALVSAGLFIAVPFTMSMFHTEIFELGISTIELMGGSAEWSMGVGTYVAAVLAVAAAVIPFMASKSEE